jgi:hypothetical protein
MKNLPRKTVIDITVLIISIILLFCLTDLITSSQPYEEKTLLYAYFLDIGRGYLIGIGFILILTLEILRRSIILQSTNKLTLVFSLFSLGFIYLAIPFFWFNLVGVMFIGYSLYHLSKILR